MRTIQKTAPLLVCLLLASFAHATPAVRDGDIIFHASRSSQSAAIQRATHSPYSHVGIVFFRDGKPFVFEAVATVRYTPLDAWIARGEGGRYVLKRLTAGISSEQVAKLRAAARQFEGKPYDLYFEWSDDRIYCSELVWKLYESAVGVRLGSLQKLREFDLADPMVQSKMRERYGTRVPLDEPVISPGSQFDSPLLSLVAKP